ncbi:MAG: ribosomal protein S18-alanine N-acetyltransferase [Propionibacteriaceae bacterium]|jgi:ribosomal-protein-alanine N-acetyltransferase|nr:ribosomal protein S18-alanine N-acetyltransferase [Propionibacteriaceae bacterium]
MSAQFETLPKLRPMGVADLDRVMQIEPAIYSHPWTRGNFEDSIHAGYSCWVVDCGGALAGYGVLMTGVREAHLLNLSVAAQWQGRGLGRFLLEQFILIARDSDAVQMFLEVRPSNVAARRLYANHGFREITVRRGYYPAARGREDAILMGLVL